MTDDTLRDLGKQLPVDRPDATRREKVRASLLAAAAAPAAPSSRRWLLVGGGFAAGALAAAAAVMLLVRPGSSAENPTVAPAHEAYARIESSTAAQLEHTLVPSATGTDEVVRVKAGTVRLAVPPTKAGDRVRVATGDAEIEGSGDYEVTVEADRIAAVTVTSGTATLRVGHQQPVFLAAGQTWRASVQTADLAVAPAPADGSQAIETPKTPPPAEEALPLKTSIPAEPPTPPIDPPRKKTSANPRTTDSGAPIETELTPDPAPAPSTSATATRRGAPIEPAIAVETPAPSSGTAASGPPAPSSGPPAPSSANPALSSAKPGPASATPASAAPANDTETHFRAGAAALRANKLAEAATELAAAAAGDGPLAADARYYQAVALIRAKRGAEAERALVMFLDRAPASSTRRGRAAIMLAKLIADRGDAAGARAWYELAAKDADPAVSAAARAALR